MEDIERRENRGSDAKNPMEVTIPYIVEDDDNAISGYCQQIVNRAVFKAYGKDRNINWKQIYVSRERLEHNDAYMPQHVIESLKNEKIIMKGPFNGFSIQLNQAFDRNIRQQLEMDLTLCPIRWLKGLPEKMISPERLDLYLFYANHLRENNDIDAFLPLSSREVNFLNHLDLALQFSLAHRFPSFTLVNNPMMDKEKLDEIDNMSYEYAMRKFGEKVFTWQQYEEKKKETNENDAANMLIEASSHNKMIVKAVMSDKLIKTIHDLPGSFSSLFVTDMNGEYLASELLEFIGGEGMGARVDLNYRTQSELFGSAGFSPNDPCGTILSARAMLGFIGFREAARLIDAALEEIFVEHKYTRDIAAQMRNSEILKPEDFCTALLKMI